MQISEGTVVSIHYTLKNDAGELLDKSDSEQPFRYLHGHGNIVSGLEDALTGKVAGDTLIVAVAAGDGYG